MQLSPRTTCRVCESPHLSPVIDLGEQYLQGAFVTKDTPHPPLTKFPTRLVRCDASKADACGLLQMAYSVPPAILYENYWYRSGVNATMRGHLKGIAESATAIVRAPDLRVLDIGCNDGTLLKSYPATFDRIGVDPSDIAHSIEAPIRVVHTVFPSDEAKALLADRKVDIVTSIAMFYDLEDPVGFARSIRDALSPRGLWVVEMSYLPTMLDMNSLDTICHEHLEYYSLAALEYIFRVAGMRAFRAELNEINGGSIRCYVTHEGNMEFDRPETTAALDRMRRVEADLALDTDRPYLAFQKRIEAAREELKSLLQSIKAQGKSVHVYGASTKGNVLLQWCGIDGTVVDCAADRNPDKHGARTLGTDIPIVSESESRQRKPDYYLVLPWHFRDEFLDRERETIVAGTKMIFPLPQVNIVGRDELRTVVPAR